ncbi:MAG: hypothetical protein KZQ81_15420 [Candidatus Thiodiazotropha sp. (ex Rostrolucina anterorostrata)]|nr:hypothetical protein [Candidatus Thiodiazotropha sp. (ex Rostrolucina anterorostrata)]
MAKGQHKKAKSKILPSQPTKSPSTSKSVGNSETQSPSWHVNTIDRQGPWGWESIPAKTLWGNLHEKLCSFETMKWYQFPQQGSHLIQVRDLCRAAQKRLVEIQQDDIDELFSLRLGGKERVWGIRDQSVLKILWWDPNHEVCPSLKKHT